MGAPAGSQASEQEASTRADPGACPRPTDVNEIAIGSEQRSAIMEAMRGVSLDYRPQWAASLSERQWNRAVDSLAPRIRTVQTDQDASQTEQRVPE